MEPVQETPNDNDRLQSNESCPHPHRSFSRPKQPNFRNGSTRHNGTGIGERRHHNGNISTPTNKTPLARSWRIDDPQGYIAAAVPPH